MLAVVFDQFHAVILCNVRPRRKRYLAVIPWQVEQVGEHMEAKHIYNVLFTSVCQVAHKYLFSSFTVSTGYLNLYKGISGICSILFLCYVTFVFPYAMLAFVFICWFSSFLVCIYFVTYAV